ncbi:MULTISPECIES: hypothetical protein [Methylobacterium]|nr:MULTISPECIES: hypothetical protein [Methylobacterium]
MPDHRNRRERELMPYPVAIVFTLALLFVGLAAIGWWQDPAAPALSDWFVAKATEGGLWSGLLLFLVAAAFFAWRDGRTRP